MPAPAHVGDLLALLAGAPSPRLTWYGPGEERVDLTGRVFAQWATKAANLLTLELDLAPGDAVRLDLPVHWRTLVWALGAWTAGAHITAEGEAQVLITSSPAGQHQQEVAVPLPALAMAFDADLPPGVIDGAADLMSQPDVLVTPPGAGPDLPAFAAAEPTQAQLLGGGETARVLLCPATVGELLQSAPRVWAAGGSVVLLADATRASEVARAEGAVGAEGVSRRG